MATLDYNYVADLVVKARYIKYEATKGLIILSAFYMLKSYLINIKN